MVTPEVVVILKRHLHSQKQYRRLMYILNCVQDLEDGSYRDAEDKRYLEKSLKEAINAYFYFYK